MRAVRTEQDRQRGARRWVAAAAVALLLLGASPVHADEYDRDRAGHPLRIVAYALHPVGVLLDTLIMRPAHWLGSKKGVRTLFGHETRKRGSIPITPAAAHDHDHDHAHDHGGD